MSISSHLALTLMDEHWNSERKAKKEEKNLLYACLTRLINFLIYQQLIKLSFVLFLRESGDFLQCLVFTVFVKFDNSPSTKCCPLS